jgi:hypothetical protein
MHIHLISQMILNKVKGGLNAFQDGLHGRLPPSLMMKP